MDSFKDVVDFGTTTDEGDDSGIADIDTLD